MQSVSSMNTFAPSAKKAFSACARLGHVMDTHMIGVSIFLLNLGVRILYPFGAVRLCA